MGPSLSKFSDVFNIRSLSPTRNCVRKSMLSFIQSGKSDLRQDLSREFGFWKSLVNVPDGICLLMLLVTSVGLLVRFRKLWRLWSLKLVGYHSLCHIGLDLNVVPVSSVAIAQRCRMGT